MILGFGLITSMPASASNTQHTALNDGTLVLIDQGRLLKVSIDGNTIPAEDGVHTLQDGKQIRTQRGMIVR
jgi:hypothetical protein